MRSFGYIFSFILLLAVAGSNNYAYPTDTSNDSGQYSGASPEGSIGVYPSLASSIFGETFVVFDPPYSTDTYVFSINAGGDVTGVFTDASEANKNRGFVRDRNGTFSVFDAPNASWGTYPMSINDRGDVAGYFIDAQNRGHGFVRDRSGEFNVFDAPNVSFTRAQSINTSGDLAGDFYGPPLGVGAFVRDNQGNLTVLSVPNGSFLTNASSINDRGEVTGYFLDSSQGYLSRCFVRTMNGQFTVFDAPNASSSAGETGANGSLAMSINYRGDVTGFFTDASQGNKNRGFVRNRNGEFSVFDAPNAVGTYPASINAGGDVIGEFVDTETGHGFLRDRSGNFNVFDAPNASVTEPTGINEKGEIAGQFKDPSRNYAHRGFLLSSHVSD